MIFNSLLQKTGCHCYCLVDKVGGRCIFAFELTQSYISRNPLIWNKLNSRGTTGINTSNMTFQVQHCQVHLCIFPPFPGKKEKFCRWPPKNWRRQQVVSEIYPCLNPTTPICPAQYCFFFFFFYPTVLLKNTMPPTPSLCSADPQETIILYGTKKCL